MIPTVNLCVSKKQHIRTFDLHRKFSALDTKFLDSKMSIDVNALTNFSSVDLMAGYYGHSAGSVYTCVDNHPDTLHGGRADQNGYLFHQVEARCGSLKCPPYVEGRELVCAVCSKK